MECIEAPADAGSGDPVPHLLQVVVVETETATHRGRGSEVEHLRGGDPGIGEVEQLRQHSQQRIRLPQRAVRESHPQPVPGMLGRAALLPQTERR